MLGKLRLGTRALREQAVEKAGELGQAISNETNRLLRDQKGQVADKIHGLGSAVDKAGRLLHAGKIDTVARYVDLTADTMEQMSKYLDEREVDEMLADLGDLAKQHRTAAVATTLLLGAAIGRFLAVTLSADEGDEDEEDSSREI